MLNFPQRLALTVTLRLFEEQLRQADAWLQDSTETGILYRRELRLSPARRAAARQVVDTALHQIAAVTREFDLAAADYDPAAAIAGEMSVCWANLCDLRADKMKRYGPVDPGLTQTLDPYMDRLADLALLLSAVVRDNPED
jgi:hypothetical protein